jgi:hypothetical protein
MKKDVNRLEDTNLQEGNWNVKFLSCMSEKVSQCGCREGNIKRRKKNTKTERDVEKRKL